MAEQMDPNNSPPGDETSLDLTPRTTVDPAARVRGKRNWLPIVVLVLVVGAGGVIVTQFLRSAVDYYCNVDEVGVRDGCDSERRIRLQGTVDEGSIEQNSGVTIFTISFNGESVPVRYDGEPGGIFKECIPVVVHGVFEDGTLHGDRVEVKHSDEYVSVNDERVAGAKSDGCNAAESGA